MSQRIAITGVGLWLPGVVGTEAWQSGRRRPLPEEEVASAQGAGLERRSRRRASQLTRALADAYFEAVAQAEVDTSEVATVFGSALGEAANMIRILDALWSGQPVSPLSFATSVHNAASGVVSISTNNRGFTTSIAADYDTSAMALMEAFGLIAARNSPVVLVCGDERSPDRFVDEARAFDMVAGALVLAPGSGGLGSISMPRMGATATEAPVEGLSERVQRNPQIGVIDLIAATLSGQHGTIRLDRGEGQGWTVELGA